MSMSRRTTVVALALAALPAVTAGAVAGIAAANGVRPHQQGPAFVLDGRGFGHGVGMSQYGARGRALQGAGHAQILAHYYPGTALERVPPRRLRVLLADGLGSVAVSHPQRWRAVGRIGPRGRAIPLRPGVVHRLLPLSGDRIALHAGTRRIAVFRGPVTVQPRTARGAIRWGERAPESSRRHRGALRVHPAGRVKLRLVNVVGLEDYLRGVVPREVPASWGRDAPEALSAQAIVARSYALATAARGPDFDLHADTRSQVYGGVPAEDPRTTRAVVETRGRVVTYDGDIATTYYHSTSGGRTEDSSVAWPGSPAVPYLVSVEDRADAISPLHTWTRRFVPARLGRLLGLPGPVTAFEVLERGRSPRVVRARVSAGGVSRELTGAQLRARLGLPDTWFTVRAP
jgi:stage II sporulation protein D